MRGLLDVSDAETAAFAWSVSLLHEELGTSSKEPSEELRRSVEVARVQSEQARLALEAYTLEAKAAEHHPTLSAEGCSDYPLGRTTVNVVPAAADELTWMLPPCADTIVRAMNKPSPMLRPAFSP